MRCLAVVPGTRRLDVVERPDPGLPGDDQVLVEMLECGVCGTDRHLIERGWGRPPAGESALVLGHEPLGRVLKVGQAVRHLRAGDYVTATNQRSCGACPSCAAGEVDLCTAAAGTGRGISGMDGFLRPRLLDDAAFSVRVPQELRAVAVLTEPLAVGEKMIEQVRQVQRRLPGSLWCVPPDATDWAAGLRFVVGGAGPVGLLMAMALRAQGGDVQVVDRSPADGRKARLVGEIGARYHCTDGHDVQDLADLVGPVDCALEAAGSADLCVGLWRSLARNGVMGMVGGASGSHPGLHPREVFGHALGRNQALVGIVASNRRHFTLALEDLGRFEARFPAAVRALITARHPFDHADGAFAAPHPDDMKQVIQVADG